MISKKDALGFIELYYFFIAYQQKVNGYKDSLKAFIKKTMCAEDIEKMAIDGEFFANALRSGQISGLCHKYNMPWENLNWVNTFRHPKEAEAIFKEIEQYSGGYPEKIYAWAQND